MESSQESLPMSTDLLPQGGALINETGIRWTGARARVCQLRQSGSKSTNAFRWSK